MTSMKKQFIFFNVICFYTGSFFAQVQQTTSFNSQQYHKVNGQWYLLDNLQQQLIPLSPNNISVKYHQGVTASQIQNFEQQHELKLIRKNILRWYDYKFSLNADLFQKCSAVQNSNLVELVEVVAPVDFQIIPNDPLCYDPPTQIWPQWGIEKAKVDKAWDKTTGDPSVVWALIDTGVDWWHQDFAQATGTTGTFWLNPGEDTWTDPNDPSSGDGIDNDSNGFVDDWRGWNFSDQDNDVSDDSTTVNAHGTAVAGVIGARTNNNLGIAGVAGG